MCVCVLNGADLFFLFYVCNDTVLWPNAVENEI